MNKVEFVYGKDSEGNNQLIGAIVYSYDGENIHRKEYYVGIREKTSKKFKEESASLNIKGRIYFPQTGQTGYLQKDDIVIDYKEGLDVRQALNERVDVYRKMAVDEKVKAKMDAKLAYIMSLDPEDPLIELNDCTVNRKRSSR